MEKQKHDGEKAQMEAKQWAHKEANSEKWCLAMERQKLAAEKLLTRVEQQAQDEDELKAKWFWHLASWSARTKQKQGSLEGGSKDLTQRLRLATIWQKRKMGSKTGNQNENVYSVSSDISNSEYANFQPHYGGSFPSYHMQHHQYPSYPLQDLPFHVQTRDMWHQFSPQLQCQSGFQVQKSSQMTLPDASFNPPDTTFNSPLQIQQLTFIASFLF